MHNVFRVMLFAALLAPWSTPALAHVKVFAEPGWTQAPACTSTEFLVFVPNERPDATTRLELDIPSSITLIDVLPIPSWTTDFVLSKGRITRVIWSGGRIHPREYQRFAFLAATPQTPQVVSWNARQTYEDGTVVSWTGPPQSDTPHSQITITPAQDRRTCRPRRYP
jgi:uncharacterized protein YcnI